MTKTNTRKARSEMEKKKNASNTKKLKDNGSPCRVVLGFKNWKEHRKAKNHKSLNEKEELCHPHLL